MSINLVTFAAKKNIFIQSQNILNKTYKNAGIDTHTMWTENDIIKTDFYKKKYKYF